MHSRALQSTPAIERTKLSAAKGRRREAPILDGSDVKAAEQHEAAPAKPASPTAVEANERLVAEALQSRPARVDSAPTFLELETTTRCNLDCLQCPRPPGPGGEDLDDRLLARLAPFLGKTRNVSLHGLGEPLMSRTTDRILDTVPSDCHVWFSSNLQLLPKRLLPLLKNRQGAVSCSLDAATEKTYALIRQGILERSLENIRLLLAETSLNVFINMTVMQVNYREVGLFLELGRKLGIHKVVLLKLNEGEDYPEARTRNGFRFSYRDQHLGPAERQQVAAAVAGHPVPFPVEDQVNMKLTENASPEPSASEADSEQENDRASGIRLTSDHHGLRCSLPYTNLSIRIDGSARVCCHQEAIGNIYQTDPSDLWNGPALRAMREALAASRLHPQCQRENCPVYRMETGRARKPNRLVAATRRTLAPLLLANPFRRHRGLPDR